MWNCTAIATTSITSSMHSASEIPLHLVFPGMPRMSRSNDAVLVAFRWQLRATAHTQKKKSPRTLHVVGRPREHAAAGSAHVRSS